MSSLSDQSDELSEESQQSLSEQADVSCLLIIAAKIYTLIVFILLADICILQYFVQVAVVQITL